MHQEIEADVAVIGGGTGGVAAAWRAARAGRTVILTEETDWIGGQLTSQGVSALDEHRYIERFGGTAGYYALREGIRAHYRTAASLTPEAAANPALNPGNGWVSRLCFEPRVGVAVLEGMLAPEEAAGRLRLLRETVPVAAEVAGDEVTAVVLRGPAGNTTRIRARLFLDATEFGDLLPLAGVEHAGGSEAAADTGEPHAPPTASARWAQSFTFPFAVEFCPGERHTIARPEGYDRFREAQPYSFTIDYGPPRGHVTYRMFSAGEGTFGPFWTYRRLIDHANFVGGGFPHDIAMINWPSNDFAGGSPIECDEAGRAELFHQARLLSLGFLYWLQTEAPRDEGGQGYPELKLRPDVMGTSDGLSKYPYVREARRILPLRRVREQDISADEHPGARAAFFADSVGVGYYSIDIHACAPDQPQVMVTSRPFQIPLAALVPARVRNVLPAAKNIGTTHITNGAYRLHPVEWNVGESAGALAAFCLEEGASPQEVCGDAVRLRRLQRLLLGSGVPLYWYEDLPLGHPAFAAAQWLAMAGIWQGDPSHLRFDPDENIGAGELAALVGLPEAMVLEAFGGRPALTRGEAAVALAGLDWGE